MKSSHNTRAKRHFDVSYIGKKLLLSNHEYGFDLGSDGAWEVGPLDAYGQ